MNINTERMFLGFLKLLVLSLILPKYGVLTSANKVRCINKEREALFHFKATLGNSFGHFAWSSWDSKGYHNNTDCCQWEGVLCSNKTGRVLMLHLAGDLEYHKVISGQISASLMELQSLMYLNLSFNTFEDAYVPQFFGYLTNLRYLDLQYCSLNGNIPSQLGNLPHLHYLDLSYNILKGSIPYQFGNLSQLQYLDLKYNFLEGSIPYQLGNLSQLQYLDLSQNSFEGKIPYQLGNLSNLKKLFLEGGTLKIDQESCVEVHWLSSLTYLTHLKLSNVTDLKYSHKWLQEIAKLPSLKELRISNNNLSDKHILSLRSLKFNSSLLVFDLSNNNFMSAAIFYWISNVSSNLFELDLSYNFLLGIIPDEFGRTMNSLETLELSDNQLKGGLKSLGNISPLRSLYLQNNQITGTLFDLSTHRSLETFDISNNLLNGTIVKDLRFPSSLRSLSLYSNSLKGVLTDHHFANLSNLKILDLSGNSLLALRFSHKWVPPFQLQLIKLSSCRLGPSFPKWLLAQKNFTELDISNAGILGTIPKCFWDQLTPKLVLLDVSYNNIFGVIPNASTIFIENPSIYLAYNHFEGPIPQFLLNASYLILSNNKFSKLHPILCASRSTDIRMDVLDISNNQLSGQLPDCWGRFKSLSFLDLSNNNLFGVVPTSIGSLQSIEILILRNNRFIEELPVSLKNCSNLLMFDVGGNKFSGPIPSWIGIKLVKLEILILRNNNFSGSLSMHLCYLSNICFLDMSLNSISGQIPKCFKNFTAMAEKNFSYLEEGDLPDNNNHGDLFSIYNVLNVFLMWKGTERHFIHYFLLKGIDLSSNQLIGRIPTELVILVEMIVLNLSRNQLDGEIPSKIGWLTSLESLDLSRNHLYGPIPSSLAHIDRLAMLDLSHNNLSGKIPIATQLQSFNSSSYEGNLDLCGKPLEKMCPEGGKHQELVEVQEDERSILSREFYWGMASGFITGFWVIFGSILFIGSWRHAYFRFVSNLCDTVYVMVTLNTIRCNMWFRSYLEKLR